MIRRIDHIIAVVDDAELTRACLLGIGCPLVWDGRSGRHRDIMFSLGAVRLELLDTAAFDGWPALADLAAHSDRQIGVRVAALDPGDLDQTISELRSLGIVAGEPQAGQLAGLGGDTEASPIARWHNAYVDGLRGLLPGLPSFLCQFLAPTSTQQAAPVPPERSADAPSWEVPIRFVELRVGVPDPGTAVLQYERVLGTRALTTVDGSGDVVVPLADTPIRLVRGSGLQLMLAPTRSNVPLDPLAAELPGVCWSGGFETK
jgi:hypothetical protein